MQEEVLATIEASAPRRMIGVGMLVVVAALVIYVALISPPDPGWQIFLILVGVSAGWLARRMWNATQDRIELTKSELRTKSGLVICSVENIESVDRGAFAFKPSNGFLIRTKVGNKYTWAPGLWWCFGRRIGVGGMTAAAETKYMSEMLTAILLENAA